MIKLVAGFAALALSAAPALACPNMDHDDSPPATKTADKAAEPKQPAQTAKAKPAAPATKSTQVSPTTSADASKTQPTHG